MRRVGRQVRGAVWVCVKVEVEERRNVVVVGDTRVEVIEISEDGRGRDIADKGGDIVDGRGKDIRHSRSESDMLAVYVCGLGFKWVWFVVYGVRYKKNSDNGYGVGMVYCHGLVCKRYVLTVMKAN